MDVHVYSGNLLEGQGLLRFPPQPENLNPFYVSRLYWDETYEITISMDQKHSKCF